MASSIRHTCIDCAHPYPLAQFWSAVLDRPLYPDSGTDDEEVGIDLGGAADLLFLSVPEGKTVKNRLHLCLRPNGRQAEEVERLLALSATMNDDRRRPEGAGWAVLADPEGNEFCVLTGTSDDPPPA